MHINDFVRERKEDWEKLDKIVTEFRPGFRRTLGREQLWQLGRLYMAAVSDLSVLKSSALSADPHNEIISYLNGLVIRVHGAIYSKPASTWSSFVGFVTATFPVTFRQTLAYTGFSFSVFFLFGLVGFFVGLQEPGFIELVVPDGIISSVERGKVWFDDLYAMSPQASSFLMTHNISVTFFTVAAGITFGVGTVYLLGLNGLLLGTVAALCAKHDLSLQFWSFVLPHGAIELSAIIIAGGAGLIIGHALVDPGPYRRTEILALRGRAAGTLALGCVPLLVVAGFTEAFFSPSPLPPWAKIAFAAVVFTLLIVFLYASGRKEDHKAL